MLINYAACQPTNSMGLLQKNSLALLQNSSIVERVKKNHSELKHFFLEYLQYECLVPAQLEM